MTMIKNFGPNKNCFNIIGVLSVNVDEFFSILLFLNMSLMHMEIRV